MKKQEDFITSILCGNPDKWQLFEAWFESKNYNVELFSHYKGIDKNVPECDGIKVALYSLPFTSLEFEFQVGVFQKFFEEVEDGLNFKDFNYTKDKQEFILNYFLT